MNQDTVKELLLKVEDTVLEFSVIFSGKASKKVNGLYKPDTHEILLHNKNFSTDNELLYTAIHEYTHHKIYEQDGTSPSFRVHTQKFWSTFHQLLKKAELKGIYTIGWEQSPELLRLTETIRGTIMTEDGKLMKELGRLLGEARTLCKTVGVRYEDYLDRVLCLKRSSASAIEKMHIFDIKPDLGYEAMKIVANISRPDRRHTAENLFLHKNSPAFVSQSINRAIKPSDDTPRHKLEKEKTRLEKTIACLQDKLTTVNNTLAAISVEHCILCIMLFTCSVLFYPHIYAESTLTATHTPTIPNITIPKPSSAAAITPPVITPPVFQSVPTPQQQTGHGINTKYASKNSAPQHRPVRRNGLNARTLSSITQNGGTEILKTLLGTGQVQNPDNTQTLLAGILAELEKLQQKTTGNSTGYASATQNTVPKNIPPHNGTKNAANIVRLRINGRDITGDFIHTFCSVKSDTGDFFYGADRRFTAKNILLQETLYLLAKKTQNGSYMLAVELQQDPLNHNSFLYKLAHLSPLQISKTSDILFWHYKDESFEIELIIRLL